MTPRVVIENAVRRSFTLSLDVPPTEYSRLLGYPREILPEGQAAILAEGARQWYRSRGTPWVGSASYLIQRMEASRVMVGNLLLTSRTLAARLRKGRAHALVVIGISAGKAVETEVAQLWADERPDAAFMLDTYASAVVEHLLKTTAARLCQWLESEGLTLLPHYSPGFAGWGLGDQSVLLNLLSRADPTAASAMRLLESGMLDPEKSMLAVWGVTRYGGQVGRFFGLCPCSTCSFSRCAYRRKPRRSPVRCSPAGGEKNRGERA